MNKQELINVPRILFPIGTEILIKGKIVGLKVLDDRFVENVVKLDYGEQIIAPNDAIYVKDEPQKVKVPPTVADWISFVKTNGLKFKNTYGFYEEIAPSDDVYRVMYHIFKESIADKEIRKWVGDNIDLFARAWLDGYEVEEKRRYRISMPKARNYMNHAQFLCEKDGKIFWCGEWHPFRTKFTRKQLEDAGFGWVFDCEGIEIEEVTE